MSKKLNIVYMAGGDEFTLKPFFSILNSKHNLLAIYTKKIKLVGRGKKKLNNSLALLAKKKNIPIFNIDKFNNKENKEHLVKLKLDFIIVFSFGIILPKEILEIPKFGSINIHTSLLPKWRGASPIQHALLNNEKETGITLIKMNEKLDEGDIVYSKKIFIYDFDNYQTILDKLTSLASSNLINVLENLILNKINLLKQDNTKATYCFKIKKEDTYIKFDNSAETVLGKIKAYSPKPGAKCFIKGEQVKILEAKVENKNIKYENYSEVLDNRLLVSCKIGSIRLTKIQRPGKNIMDALQVMNGWQIKKGLMLNEN